MTVTDVTETATFTINAIANASVNENNVYTSATPSITGSPIGSITYSLSGGADQSAFTINNTTGVVSMVARDFENPVDADNNNTYELQITATDQDNNTATQSWTVTVNDLNDEVPIITGQNPLTMDEEASLTIILTDLMVTDPDNLFPDDFTLVIQAGTNYSVSGNVITPDVDFNEVLSIPVLVNDGVNMSNVFNLMVTVSPINDIPIVVSQVNALITDEDIPLTIDLSSLNVADPDNVFPNDFTLTVESGTNYSASENTLTPDADFNGELIVPVTVSDGLASSVPFNLTVTVNPVNDVPVFTSFTSLEDYLEDAVISIFDFNANDGDGGVNDDVVYTVLGPDEQIFTISSNGELAFVAPPDYENPLDNDQDNGYQIIINVSDGILSTNLDVMINVLDDLGDNGNVEIIAVDTEGNDITIKLSDSENIDVGITALNVEKATLFEIINTGQLAIDIQEISLPDINFEITSIPSRIEVEESFEFEIVLLATQTGIFTSTVSIVTSIGAVSFEITGEVINLPKVEVKNVVTPNGDGKHDFLKIVNIEFYPDNIVEIFTRAGDKVFSIDKYNNSDRVFNGFSNNRSTRELETGTYYYTIRQGRKRLGVGFLLLRR